MDHQEYIDAGLKVFGLYGVKDEMCECGNPECKAFFKHPRTSAWQHTPHWSEDQLEVFEEMGHFKSGFGVLVSGLLVVDVDARNGGVPSYEKLCALIPAIKDAGFIVETGSGGGSKHVYFSLPEPIAMVQTHKEFSGIDFKTSGFVVGAGSIHASGNLYEVETGDPSDITPAPQALIELLKKPERHRAVVDGQTVDVSDADLRDMLSYIDPSCGHEEWIRIGMALHHATQGSGFALWDDWSAGGDTYPSSSELDKRWQSFGKSSNPVSLGTLMHYAKEGGYSEPVEFTPSVTFDMPEETTAQDIDLLRPPGFVGQLADWINSQSLYPRESLAVAAALTAISNIAGMRYRDEMDGMTPNIIAFCVAGSGTGKEAVGKAFAEIMRVCDLSPALYGAFKSEQELYRNLLRHQAAFYSVDELGIQLTKVKNAMTRGGASYLEGLLGAVMSVYSKADSFLPITGDLKEEIRQQLSKEYAAINKQLDDGRNSDLLERKLKTVERQLSTIDQGIDSPYLSIIGYTTPTTFDGLFDYEQATNGFLSRSMIFREKENNPKRKSSFKKSPMSEQMKTTLRNIHAPGSFSVVQDARIEFTGEKTSVPTTDEAAELLDSAYQYFWELAEQHKNQTGLEAVPRRGYEMASKVSLILALPEGLRTAEHVKWAVALAKQDIDAKLLLAHSNSAESETDRMAAKIISFLSKSEGQTIGVIKNRVRGFDPAVLDRLVESGHVIKQDTGNERKGQPVIKYFKNC